MSFNKLIKNTKNNESNTSSWLNEPLQAPKTMPPSIDSWVNADLVEAPKKISDRWEYETTENGIKHILPYSLSKAKNNNTELSNWIKTIMMCIEFNGRYKMCEFRIPVNLQRACDGFVTIYTTGINRAGMEEVIWYAKKGI
jgi:hypothetical protein